MFYKADYLVIISAEVIGFITKMDNLGFASRPEEERCLLLIVIVYIAGCV